MSDLSAICLILLMVAGGFIGLALAQIATSDLYLNFKKRSRRKLSTIHLKKKRDEELERTLWLNHMEYRLQHEYNVDVLYEVYKEHNSNPNYDEISVILVDRDTNKMVWNKLTRWLDVPPVIMDVLDQLDKGDAWNMIW